MKKIPTLFEREYKDHKVVGIKPILTSQDLQWVLDGEGIATEKIDGACCAVINGGFYKRYDAKKGKTPPENAIPCCDPDPITGHWPHWVPILAEDPSSRWFIEGIRNTNENYLLQECTRNLVWEEGTYEAIGPHFQGNPYKLKNDIWVKHGKIIIHDLDCSFEGLRDYLMSHKIEGIVFWKDGEPQCKIKRSDYGFKWPL